MREWGLGVTEGAEPGVCYWLIAVVSGGVWLSQDVPHNVLPRSGAQGSYMLAPIPHWLSVAPHCIGLSSLLSCRGSAGMPEDILCNRAGVLASRVGLSCCRRRVWAKDTVRGPLAFAMGRNRPRPKHRLDVGPQSRRVGSVYHSISC